MPIPLSELPSQAVEKHIYYHHPYVNERNVQPIPYLTLPFRRGDVDHLLEISEGWDYSEKETGITGYENHKAVDYAVDTGTKVVAPCDALAIASYHNHRVTRRLPGGIEEPVFYKGKPVGSGLGLFVQLYIPQLDRYVQLGHLNSISPAIHFSKPVPDGKKGWQPTNYNLPPHLISTDNPMIVPVKRGEPIGTVGSSGLTLGYVEYMEEPEMLTLYPPSFSWDIPHLHMIETGRRLANGDNSATVKTCARDVYDLYNFDHVYPTNKSIGQGERIGVGPESLFYLDDQGLPLYADDLPYVNLLSNS